MVELFQFLSYVILFFVIKTPIQGYLQCGTAKAVVTSLVALLILYLLASWVEIIGIVRNITMPVIWLYFMGTLVMPGIITLFTATTQIELLSWVISVLLILVYERLIAKETLWSLVDIYNARGGKILIDRLDKEMYANMLNIESNYGEAFKNMLQPAYNNASGMRYLYLDCYRSILKTGKREKNALDNAINAYKDFDEALKQTNIAIGDYQRKQMNDEKRRQQDIKDRMNGNASDGKQYNYYSGNDGSSYSGSNGNTEQEYFHGCDTKESVQTRFRDLAKVYHPDAGNGDAATFQKIKEQYDGLMEKYK